MASSITLSEPVSAKSLLQHKYYIMIKDIKNWKLPNKPINISELNDQYTFLGRLLLSRESYNYGGDPPKLDLYFTIGTIWYMTIIDWYAEDCNRESKYIEIDFCVNCNKISCTCNDNQIQLNYYGQPISKNKYNRIKSISELEVGHGYIFIINPLTESLTEDIIDNINKNDYIYSFLSNNKYIGKYIGTDKIDDVNTQIIFNNDTFIFSSYYVFDGKIVFNDDNKNSFYFVDLGVL
jgi:hypothetical protein